MVVSPTDRQPLCRTESTCFLYSSYNLHEIHSEITSAYTLLSEITSAYTLLSEILASTVLLFSLLLQLHKHFATPAITSAKYVTNKNVFDLNS